MERLSRPLLRFAQRVEAELELIPGDPPPAFLLLSTLLQNLHQFVVFCLLAAELAERLVPKRSSMVSTYSMVSFMNDS